MAHQHDPARRPDADYEPGELRHLVVGNRGRLLDPRRTPVAITELRMASGEMVIEILGFEDTGARWTLPFEDAGDFQFERGSAIAPPAVIAEIDAAVERFDRPLAITGDPAAAARTRAQIAEITEDARRWLIEHGGFHPAGAALDLTAPTGSAVLADDLRRYLTARGVHPLESLFADRYVTNPRSGELIKGHRIVLAEAGLVPYAGTIVRGTGVFDGAGRRELRHAHVVHRIAFVRAAFRLAGIDAIRVYRGLCLDGPLEPPRNRTFVSTTVELEVARSCAGVADPAAAGVILHQRVPIERVFMTYLETAELNQHYQEQEVVLLFDPDNRVF